ncbi:Ppx/GppA phosphatase family protein [Deinococcus maricopensis]|uniref:Ppx/GppA phosphatase n=1 Tax=Deinococcus maricopensis (strain DSM 21211 / LMG 22137 / NRRL B-23946 / LB-34) TaxID=709986 RepID=E8U4G5_DEIML|nr:Ppx/GppA phosphatase family protein [Deinococcus maricopensis]ADV68830.1 Ppx/GppA phosphatase [Deinococcus maricopensis DSM 21211]
MRFAVADVGTNSCHLLLAEARSGGYRVLDALKVRTRLGAHLDQGRLNEEGVARLVEAVSHFRDLARAAQVHELRLYATSAVREARNRDEVLARVAHATGVPLTVISGEREGQLTYLGAAHSVQFGPDNVLLDLGGGSLELARGDERGAHHVVSLPVGSERMRALLDRDPPSEGAVREVMATVRGALLPHLQAFTPGADTTVIGSSGTFEAAGALLMARAGATGSVNGFTFPVADLAALLADLRKLGPAKRARVPGLDVRRTDIIIPGLAVLVAALETLGAGRVTVSEGALREGMLVEALAQEAEWEAGLSARERSVLDVAARFHADLPHGRHVARLARDVLGRLAAHGERFPPESADLLGAAALLHEVGLAVAQSSHHKHSAYLIRHAGLRGFSPTEVELIALLARYHRKSAPKPTHPEFTSLSAERQGLVRRLAGVLRVADGLDRSHAHASAVQALTRAGRTWTLTVTGARDLDLSGARDKADVWGDAFGPLTLQRA